MGLARSSSGKQSQAKMLQIDRVEWTLVRQGWDLPRSSSGTRFQAKMLQTLKLKELQMHWKVRGRLLGVVHRASTHCGSARVSAARQGILGYGGPLHAFSASVSRRPLSKMEFQETQIQVWPQTTRTPPEAPQRGLSCTDGLIGPVTRAS